MSTSIPSLKELQAEFIEINPKRITFIGVPTLRIPFPVDRATNTEAPTFATDQDDYWQWIGYIEARGQELAAAAGTKGSQEPRYAPEHKCWRLWVAVTWYEDLYCTLTGQHRFETLMERDRTMSAIVARVGASAAAKAEEIRHCESHRERAHAEDVETLRGLLDAKDRLLEAKNRDIAKLKAALQCFMDP